MTRAARMAAGATVAVAASAILACLAVLSSGAPSALRVLLPPPL